MNKIYSNKIYSTILGLIIILPCLYVKSVIENPHFIVDILLLLGVVFGGFFFFIGTMPQRLRDKYELDANVSGGEQ